MKIHIFFDYLWIKMSHTSWIVHILSVEPQISPIHFILNKISKTFIAQTFFIQNKIELNHSIRKSFEQNVVFPIYNFFFKFFSIKFDVAVDLNVHCDRVSVSLQSPRITNLFLFCIHKPLPLWIIHSCCNHKIHTIVKIHVLGKKKIIRVH